MSARISWMIAPAPVRHVLLAVCALWREATAGPLRCSGTGSQVISGTFQSSVTFLPTAILPALGVPRGRDAGRWSFPAD